MSIFPACCSVLESIRKQDAYQGAYAETRNFVADIDKAYLNLSSFYQITDADRVPSYADELSRAGYIKVGLTINAYAFQDLIPSVNELCDLRRDDLTLDSIGSGPGTEGIGLYKYYIDNGIQPPVNLKFRFYDKEQGWRNCMDYFKTANALPQNSSFENLNFGERIPDHVLNKFETTDIFSFSYSFSEFFPTRTVHDVIRENINQIVEKAKLGSIFIVIDIDQDAVKSFVKNIMSNPRLVLKISPLEDGVYQLPPREQKTDLGDFFSIRTLYPRLTTQLFCRTYQIEK